VDTKPLVGHLAAWSYFESVDTPENKAFIKKWRDYSKKPNNVTNDPMESAYILFHMWVQAVQQARTTDVDAVRQAMIGQKFKSPSGVEVTMLPNHHMAKPVMIGEIQADGQFSIVYQSAALPPKPWGPYVEANEGRVADWSWPWACGAAQHPNIRPSDRAFEGRREAALFAASGEWRSSLQKRRAPTFDAVSLSPGA